jgi:hypothetical protein
VTKLTVLTDPERPRYLVALPRGRRVYHYWQPSAELRRDGHLPRRLSDEYGGEKGARAQAVAINDQLDRERAATAAGDPGGMPSRKKGTVAWLIREFEGDRRYRKIGPKTRRQYDQLMGVIGGKFGDAPIASLTRPVLERWYNKLQAATPWQANAMMRMCHRLLHFAWTIAEIKVNPAAKMELVVPDPRHQLWEDDQAELFVEVATDCGRRSLGLALMLGRALGQRQSDVLNLNRRKYYVVNGRGRFRVRQAEGSKWIEVIATEELQELIEATPKTSTHFVVNERTGLPYTESRFIHDFAAVRNFAANADPALEELQYRDARRTCVVEMARAGATAPEIAAVTGHEIGRVVKILETYLPRDSIMAEHAIVKLDAWKRKKRNTKVGGKDA